MMSQRETRYASGVVVTDVEDAGPEAVYERIAVNLEYARENTYHTIYIGPGKLEDVNGTIMLTTLDTESLIGILQTMIDKIKGTLS